MVMRTMRDNTKWIMLVLTVAFVGWLVFDWVQGGGATAGAATNPVVGVVDGREIHYSEWSLRLENRLAQARQQAQGALTEEQVHRVTEEAWERMVNDVLLERELERLGLEATAAEVRQAFRTQPPPEFRNHPAFQTDGRFDFQKYRDFFGNPNVDEVLLLQIEDYYRQTLPRAKLFQLVADQVVLSPAELWEVYRHRNERVRVRYVSVAPAALLEGTPLEVSEEAIREQYEEHRERYRRPPTAVVDLVSLTAQPSSADSARARARLDSLRSVVVDGERSMDELVEAFSGSAATAGIRAAEVGPVESGELLPMLAEVADTLTVGRLSEAIPSPAGYHLLQVTAREEGRITLRQLLVPVGLSEDSEDALFDRMDRLEGLALRIGLAAAADSLGWPVRRDLRLEEGAEFVPGAGALAVGVDWALDPTTVVGDLSQFFENAGGYHVLELKDRLPAATRPLEEVAGEIRDRLLAARVEREARRRFAEAIARARQEGGIDALARREGWEVSESDWFTREQLVPGLGRQTEAVGAAFGLEPGRLAGPFEAGGRLAAIELIERQPASRERFREALPALRNRLLVQRQQEHLQRWIEALRAEASVQDLRDRLGAASQTPI